MARPICDPCTCSVARVKWQLKECGHLLCPSCVQHTGDKCLVCKTSFSDWSLITDEPLPPNSRDKKRKRG